MENKEKPKNIIKNLIPTVLWLAAGVFFFAYALVDMIGKEFL